MDFRRRDRAQNQFSSGESAKTNENKINLIEDEDSPSFIVPDTGGVALSVAVNA